MNASGLFGKLWGNMKRMDFFAVLDAGTRHSMQSVAPAMLPALTLLPRRLFLEAAR